MIFILISALITAGSILSLETMLTIAPFVAWGFGPFVALVAALRGL